MPMSDSSPERKRQLAAVVFTDVVGYSARMQRDEETTISSVEADLEKMRALCMANAGTVCNSMGDGLMIYFASAVKAMEFALAAQREFARRNASSQAPLEHRIGIHLGDIVALENGAIAGDGVNIASRLEAKAPPGGICISQAIYDTVVGKVPMRAAFAGAMELKNIAQPIPAWNVWPEGVNPPIAAISPRATGNGMPLRRGPTRTQSWLAAILCVATIGTSLFFYWRHQRSASSGQTAAELKGAETAAGPLSIVVLPFSNLSGDADQAYFADGLTASVTADLSRIRDAFVVNTATAFTYKDKVIGAQQVGKEVGTRFVLQGSVQRSGTSIRINAQLADTVSNAQLWSETFEGDQSDLFALQDQVTARIGNSIGREIVILAGRDAETRKSNPKVADLMLRIRALTLKSVQSIRTFQEVEALCREIIALEPDHAGALGYLAASLSLQAGNFGEQMDMEERNRKFEEGRKIAERVKVLDPDNSNAYMAFALYAVNHQDYDGYRRAVETSVTLNPKFPGAYLNLSGARLRGGDGKKAIEALEQALTLDPRNPNAAIFSNMSEAQFMLGNNEAAIDWALKSLEKNPASAHSRAFLAMAYTLKGDSIKAQAAAAELRRTSPTYTLARFDPDPSRPAAYKQYFEKKLAPAWRKAGLPE